MAKFYSNENFPLPVVDALRRLGHDVLTIQETGGASERISDSQVLDFAISLGRAVLTLNRRDFMRLHRARSDHCGIVVCTADRDFSGQAVRIHQNIDEFPSLNGRLVRVNRPS